MTGDTDAGVDSAVLDALVDSVGGDSAFVVDLLQTYLADAETQRASIEAAVASQDAAALVRPAHTLKSASLTVGAMRVGELSRSLEQHGRSGDLAGADVDVGALRAQWPLTTDALRAWLSERGMTS